MKVHEYQAKELLKKAGVAVPEGIVVTTPAEAARAYDALGGGLIVVKAQVHAGGRGKGVAVGPDDDRDAGARDRQRAQAPARRRWPRACSSSGRPRRPRRPPPACWARRWSPTRPAPQGSPISKVLVTVGHDIARELYLGMADRPRPPVPGR